MQAITTKKKGTFGTSKQNKTSENEQSTKHSLIFSLHSHLRSTLQDRSCTWQNMDVTLDENNTITVRTSGLALSWVTVYMCEGIFTKNTLTHTATQTSLYSDNLHWLHQGGWYLERDQGGIGLQRSSHRHVGGLETAPVFHVQFVWKWCIFVIMRVRVTMPK